MMNKKFIEILLKIELSLLGVLISCLIFFVILVTFNNQKFEIDWTIILNAASVMVLLGTMIFIAGQTEATKKSVECQIMPSIEMFMIHDREGGNSFAFYNLSSVPGIINFSLSFQQNQEACELKYENENISYRIPPQGVLITANTFFVKKRFKENNGVAP